jgi:hypothetical protein
VTPQDTSTKTDVLLLAQMVLTLPSTQDNVTTVMLPVKLVQVVMTMIVSLVIATTTSSKVNVSLHVHQEPMPTKTPRPANTALTHVPLVPEPLPIVSLVLKPTSYT